MKNPLTKFAAHEVADPIVRDIVDKLQRLFREEFSFDFGVFQTIPEHFDDAVPVTFSWVKVGRIVCLQITEDAVTKNKKDAGDIIIRLPNVIRPSNRLTYASVTFNGSDKTTQAVIDNDASFGPILAYAFSPASVSGTTTKIYSTSYTYLGAA